MRWGAKWWTSCDFCLFSRKLWIRCVKEWSNFFAYALERAVLKPSIFSVLFLGGLHRDWNPVQETARIIHHHNIEQLYQITSDELSIRLIWIGRNKGERRKLRTSALKDVQKALGIDLQFRERCCLSCTTNSQKMEWLIPEFDTDSNLSPLIIQGIKDRHWSYFTLGRETFLTKISSLADCKIRKFLEVRKKSFSGTLQLCKCWKAWWTLSWMEEIEKWLAI